jgi:hypothetical protein
VLRSGAGSETKKITPNGQSERTGAQIQVVERFTPDPMIEGRIKQALVQALKR